LRKPVYRAAAFDITGRKTSVTPSVIFHFICKNARQGSSTVFMLIKHKTHDPI